MKKVAFIGCSHFSCFQCKELLGTDSWTWQLAQKFPQNQYRNYSEGGRGLEYFEWCLHDAKKWGADVVFLNRTYAGRWAFLLDPKNEDQFDSKDTFKDLFQFNVSKHTDNWEEANYPQPYLWGTGSSVNLSSAIHNDKQRKELLHLANVLYINYYSSYARMIWEDTWYSNILDNNSFSNLFLLHWCPEQNKYDSGSIPRSSITTNIGYTTVMDFLKAYSGVDKDEMLVDKGIIRSKDDNHLTLLGNKVLLEEYILSQSEVIKSLT